MRTPTHHNRKTARGFTLLEVVVAMAILALALMAIFDLNSGALSTHAYTKRLTVASMLARGKMVDLEQKLLDEGFPTQDDEESGDFDDEGWPSFKWRARILAPKTSNLSPEQVIGALVGIPMGGGEEGSDDPLSGMLGMFAGGGDAKAPGGAAGMAGSAAAMAGPMFNQMVQQIGNSVREVQLTVYWKDGNQVESIDLVTHVVATNAGQPQQVTQ